MKAVTLGQRFRRVRRQLGETQADFGRRFGVGQSSVAKWERNLHLPEGHKLDLLAELEENSNDYELPGKIDDSSSQSLFTLVPVVGEIGAGAAVYPIQEDQSNKVTGYVRAARGFGAVQALQIRGNSMWPAYRDGDWVFIENRPTEFPLRRETDYLIDLADGRRLLKMVEPGQNEGRYNLVSYNAPIESDVEIVGAHQVRYVRRA
jgi:transcriptional regulator with XRE-family HTH domain